MKNIILIALIFMTILACNNQHVDTKAEAEKVMQASRAWAQAAATGDVEKIVSYWADDAVVMSPGQPVLKGKKEIRQMIEGSMKAPGFKIHWEPQTAEVSQNGDMAYLLEKTQITFNDSSGKAITEHFNAVSVWKKQVDGSWKNVVDISTNEPEK